MVTNGLTFGGGFVFMDSRPPTANRLSPTPLRRQQPAPGLISRLFRQCKHFIIYLALSNLILMSLTERAARAEDARPSMGQYEQEQLEELEL